MAMTNRNGAAGTTAAPAVQRDELHALLPPLPAVLVRDAEADGGVLAVPVPALKVRTLIRLKQLIEGVTIDFLTTLEAGQPNDYYVERLLQLVRRLDTGAIYTLFAEIMDTTPEWVAAHDEVRWMREVIAIIVREEELADLFRKGFRALQPWLGSYLPAQPEPEPDGVE